MNESILCNCDSHHHNNTIFEQSPESTSFTISQSDMCLFIEKFTEFGEELTSLRIALLAHQNSVRKIILDSEITGDDSSI